MKKSFVKGLCLSVLCLIFAGCSSPVFYNIRKEVSLQDATVYGDINSLVRWEQDGKNYFVCQSGSAVYYKEEGVERTGSSSVWKERKNKTFSSVKYSYESGDYKGEYILKCAADSSYVYILTAVIKMDTDNGESNPSEYKIYYTDDITSDSWTLCDFFTGENTLNSFISYGRYEAAPTIFCTNSIEKAGRHAYLRNNEKVEKPKEKNTQKCNYYELGGATPAVTTAPDTKADGTDGFAKSCIWFDGNVLFFSSNASVTNETKNSAADKYYFGKDKELCYFDGTAAKTAFKGTGTISAIAVSGNSLLFGQNDLVASTVTGGLHKLDLTDGVPSDKTAQFSTNASAAFTSSYQVLTLLAEDPEKEETDNIIYTSITFRSAGTNISVSFENVGLWAYYPSRQNWNRE